MVANTARYGDAQTTVGVLYVTETFGRKMSLQVAEPSQLGGNGAPLATEIDEAPGTMTYSQPETR
jgi:hypothetical protein